MSDPKTEAEYLKHIYINSEFISAMLICTNILLLLIVTTLWIGLPEYHVLSASAIATEKSLLG